MKRIFDFVAALVGLVLLSPLLLLTALIIKLDSRGPVLFRQERLGLWGRPFRIFKFRTMRTDAEKSGHAITLWNDHRITRLGRFLRAHRIDELPQLVNVLRGQMSFVGPRPEVPKYQDCFRGALKHVLSVRPGITDPATLKYRNEASLLRNQADPEAYYREKILPNKLEINLNYIYQSTFLRDLQLIIHTICVSFFPGMAARFSQVYTEVRAPMTLQQWFNERFLVRMSSHRRRLAKMAADGLFIIAAYFMAFLIRFDGSIPASDFDVFARSQFFLLGLTLFSFHRLKLYTGLYEYSSIKDLMLLISAHTIGWSAFVVVQHFFATHWTPRSVLVIYWLLGLVLMGGVRFSYRILVEFIGLRQGNRKRVLIVGAGAIGEMIIRQMGKDTRLGYYPVCLVDDNPKKRDISLHGVRVAGGIDDIPGLVDKKRISEIIIATRRLDPATMRRVVSLCEEAGVEFKTVPGPREIMNGSVKLDELRGIKIEDLLDREPVRTDGVRIGAFLEKQVVLVTGAGGSIGRELCRQIMEYRPGKLLLMDRNENSLFYLEDDLKEQWGNGHEVIVGDICDSGKVEQVLRKYRPAVIFHAAAHKHVPLMELHPEEAIKNNVRGTMVVADAAAKFGIERFVLISTDKAVDPVNIMGASKRLAEMYIQALNPRVRTRFITVRFGNVLGSNGSVVTLFQKQIANRRPVTVTDPNMTRYFMTIAEAVTLILQASTMGEGGEIFVLDMGQPVKVLEMARHLISMSGLVPGRDIPIRFTGRRPGEKMDERLWQEGETPQKTEFGKILVARSSDGYPANGQLTSRLKEIVRHAESMQRAQMVEKLDELLPSYKVNGSVKHGAQLAESST